MSNRFIILTTCYNVEPYIQMNLYVNKFQAYDNVLFVYVDDKSKDTTLESIQKVAKDDERFLVISNPNNGSQAKAFMYGIEYLEQNNLIQDEDIIVEVDGDDWLASPFVLAYLNQIYQNKDVWMTYGQYQMWPTGQVGGHYLQEINDQVDQANAHRQVAFPYSHLKSYKYWLFNKIDRQDLIDPTTGQLFGTAWDHALCVSMVEMAGKKHICMCPDITYILNRAPELQNEGKSRTAEQKQTEQRVRQQKVYNKL